jgi:DNA-binding CsgD family transcriptional regulator
MEESVQNDVRSSYLTARERTVYDLLVTGFSRKEIAKRLGLSQNTVKNRMYGIYLVFDVHTQRELMRNYWMSYQFPASSTAMAS